MTPIATLIIPNLNNNPTLPDLFESILAQKVADLEVILVDDGSAESCEQVVEAYRNMGLSIVLIQNAQRAGTLLSKATAIRHAQGEIIAFADADDILLGEGSFNYHLAKFKNENADILQFSYMHLAQDLKPIEYGKYLPIKENVSGLEIFDNWIECGTLGAYTWTRMYKKSIFYKFLNVLEKNPNIWRMEEVLINSLFYFESQKYIGSDTIGYGYREIPKPNLELQKAFQNCRILEIVSEYLNWHNCPAELVAKYQSAILRRIALSTSRYLIRFYPATEYTNLNIVSFLKENAEIPVEYLLKLLFFTNSSNAQKILDMNKIIQRNY